MHTTLLDQVQCFELVLGLSTENTFPLSLLNSGSLNTKQKRVL